MNNAFFPHTCTKCGHTDEARFVYAGPHVKQVCNHCGFYVKFFPIGSIPDVREIRLKIWHAAAEDLELITRAKHEAEFTERRETLAAKMQWWRVWLKVREKVFANK